MKKRFLGLVAAAASVVLVGAGCGPTPAPQPTPMPVEPTPTPVSQEPNPEPMPTPESPNNQEPSPAPQSEPAPAPTPAPSPAPQAVKEFTVTAKNWEFAPSSITVKKGDRVRLKITSVDVAHGLALTDFNVSVHVEPGQTQTVEFVADKVGTFTFFCNVFCGEGHRGMKGIFVVQP